MNKTAVPAIMGLAIRWGHKGANRNHTSMGRGLLAGGTDTWGPQMRPGSSRGAGRVPGCRWVCVRGALWHGARSRVSSVRGQG